MAITNKSQPQMVGTCKFDITDLKVSSEAQMMPAGDVLDIVDSGETFTLALDFEGSGWIWSNHCTAEWQYTVTFSAESIGPTPPLPDPDLGSEIGNLVPGQQSYRVEHPVVNGISVDGVYEISAMVTFKDKNGVNEMGGVLGFAEGLIVQVHHVEKLP